MKKMKISQIVSCVLTIALLASLFGACGKEETGGNGDGKEKEEKLEESYDISGSKQPQGGGETSGSGEEVGGEEEQEREVREFEPLPEIVNSTLEDGLLQIGSEVFKPYDTVEHYIEQLKNCGLAFEYLDIIDLDSVWSAHDDYVHFYNTSVGLQGCTDYDSSAVVFCFCNPTNEPIRFGDCFAFGIKVSSSLCGDERSVDELIARKYSDSEEVINRFRNSIYYYGGLRGTGVNGDYNSFDKAAQSLPSDKYTVNPKKGNFDYTITYSDIEPVVGYDKAKLEIKLIYRLYVCCDIESNKILGVRIDTNVKELNVVE